MPKNDGGRKARLTPKFTANFANQLLKAKTVGNSDPFFSVTCVLPKDHPFWKDLEGYLHEVLKEKFGRVPKKIRDWPIKDGDATDYDDWQGCYYFAPKRYEDDGAPEIIDRDREDIIDRSEIYSGMSCRVSYRASAWFHQPTNASGVSIYLDNVQKLGDGEPIGRVTPKAIDDFGDYVDDEEEEGDSALD